MTGHEADAFDEPYEDPGPFLDEIEVERLMQGDRTIPLYRGVRPGWCSGRTLTLEVVETVRRLAAHGLNDAQISQRLNGRLSQGAVLKVRKRNDIPNGRVQCQRRAAA